MNGRLLNPVPRRALNLAVVTETYPPEINGVAQSLGRLVDGLRARGHHIQLVRPRQQTSEQGRQQPGFCEVLSAGLPIPYYPNLRLGLPARRRLRALWQNQRPDLVHIITEGPLGWSALQAARELRIPVCSDFRTNFHRYSAHYGIGRLQRLIIAYLRTFHNRTQATLVPTDELRQELARSGFENLAVISRGVDTGHFTPERRDDGLRRQWGVDDRGETPVVLHVGRIAAEKNLTALNAAFAEIRRRCPSARLLLVGDGPETGKLRSRWPDAIFTGMLRGEALARHYASADFFLFPSLTETFGNVTLEAMASGLPVVAFDYAAAREHVRHGINGLIADCTQPHQFTAAAGEMVDCFQHDRARFNHLGERARATARTLDWSDIVNALESLLHRLADPPTP